MLAASADGHLDKGPTDEPGANHGPTEGERDDSMTKIALVGAGSAQFGCGTLGDIFTSPLLADAEIALHDINADALRPVHAAASAHVAEHGLRHRIGMGTDLRSALQGADFVILSIEVGDRFALWEQDMRIPLQYGIPQVFGENGGPGGLFHALRIIPPILEICRTTLDVAPDATVFNYSNPMSRICTAVTRRFPDLPFVGLCHEIASLERHLPPMLDCRRSDLHFRAAGLNHLSVLAEVTVRGEDAYPEVLARAPDYFASLPGYSELLAHSRKTGESIETEGFFAKAELPSDTVRPWSDRRLFAVMLEHFGRLPITTDSHLGEYIGWAHDVADHRGILDFFEYYRNHLSVGELRIAADLKERVVPIMEGMILDSGYEEAAVNVPNQGAIRQLPDWIAAEVPANIHSSGPEPIAVGLPPGIAGLLTNQIGIHDLTAEAAIRGSRELAIQALLVDPVTTCCSGVPELVDQMIAEQNRWLGYLR